MVSFEELYQTIAPKLANFLIAGGAGYAVACVIVQETFMRLWKMRDELEDDEHQVSGLVYTIAKNIQLDRFRREKRLVLQPEITDEDAGSVTPEMFADERTAELRRRLTEAFAQLPPLLREAYTLFQIMELPIAEIARRTQVSEANVKVRIFRAKEKLKPLLKDLL